MRAMPSPTEITDPVSETSIAPLVVFNLLAENAGNFVRSNLSHSNLYLEPQMDTDKHR